MSPAESRSSALPPLREAIALALAAAVLVASAATDLDGWLGDAMFDRSRGEFVWRHAWLAEAVLHDGLRRLMTAIGVAIIGCALADALRRWPSLGALGRLRLRAIAFCAVVIPLAVALLKRFSATHCPWDLARYGGTEAYVRLLDPAPQAPAGHCFPAGHATSVLWLIGLAFLWLPHAPRTARRVAAAALGAGVALGWVQQLRGAHFMSHTLWSVWIAAAVFVATSAWFRHRAGAADDAVSARQQSESRSVAAP